MADPICRWRNTSIKQVSEFTQILPHCPMRKDDARVLVEKQWHEWDGGNDFFRTPYQLAAQLGLYYEDDTMFYPRFDHVLTISEARQYIEGWIRRYYVPNPYTGSIRYEGQPIILNSQLYQAALSGESDLTEFFRSRLGIDLGNKDILTNILNNFSDIKVENGRFGIKQETSIGNLTSQNNSENKKAFFETFNDIQIDKPKATISNNISHQVIYYGAPGTGKSHKIKLQLEGVPKENIFRTTFHPDSDYSTFVGAYKPTRGKRPLYGLFGKETVRMKDGEELFEDVITYKFIPQSFLNAYIRAYQTDDNVCLIIEELNRGNCAQIFGDLFQLLDRDKNGVSEYAIKADTDLRTFLEEELGKDNPGIKDGELRLPSNLYIYATMNTSDQSLFPIDSAFKRRWDWEYEPIKYKNTDWKIVIDGTGYSWVSFQRIVNEKILRANKSEDKMLGDYFVNPADGVITDKVLLNKILFYLWNDVCKDGEGDIFKVSETEDVSFSELYGDGGKQKIISMMDYLRISKIENNTENIDDDDDTKKENGGTGKDRTRYAINGVGEYAKKNLAAELVKLYIEQNPTLSALEVVDKWKSLGKFVSHFIETQEEYDIRTDKEPRVRTIQCGNENIYVSTNGWGGQGIMDSLINAIPESWNLKVEKIQ